MILAGKIIIGLAIAIVAFRITWALESIASSLYDIVQKLDDIDKHLDEEE